MCVVTHYKEKDKMLVATSWEVWDVRERTACRMACSAVNRLEGSGSSSARIKSLAIMQRMMRRYRLTEE